MIELVTVALRGIALLAHNKDIGGSRIGGEKTSELLNMLAMLVQGGSEVHRELREFSEEIADMAEQGRNPSVAQFQRLRERSAVANAIIEQAGRRLEEAGTSGEDTRVGITSTGSAGLPVGPSEEEVVRRIILLHGRVTVGPDDGGVRIVTDIASGEQVFSGTDAEIDAFFDHIARNAPQEV